MATVTDKLFEVEIDDGAANEALARQSRTPKGAG
jgi:hypothetical protein